MCSDPPIIPDSGSKAGDDVSVETHSPPAHLRRRMVKTMLNGQHTHATCDGRQVHIVMRDGKYLARGRHERRQFGVTLGTDSATAAHQLRRLLTELEDGTFAPASERPHRMLKPVRIGQLSLRDLVDEFLADRRQTKGRTTAQNYLVRLRHVLEYGELAANRKRWPLASRIDRQFVLGLRSFLLNRDVTRNGSGRGRTKKMTPKMVRLCMETLQIALNWARSAEVRRLPPEFVNPVTDEVIGIVIVKDPLRTNPVPLDKRLQMVSSMDAWQLMTLVYPLVLPLRFEDLAGALVSDFDLTSRSWRIGDPRGGNDMCKSRVVVQMPLPVELLPLLSLAKDQRVAGPMFRRRGIVDGSQQPRIQIQQAYETEVHFEEAMKRSPAGEVCTHPDRKRLFRKMLVQAGAVTTDTISRELKTLMAVAGVQTGTVPYALRSATTTDMKSAGVDHLSHRYLTAHSIGDIMNEYTSLEPQREMQKYFDAIQQLLQRIQSRTFELFPAAGRSQKQAVGQDSCLTPEAA